MVSAYASLPVSYNREPYKTDEQIEVTSGVWTRVDPVWNLLLGWGPEYSQGKGQLGRGRSSADAL